MKILTEEQISNIYHSTMEGNEMDYVKAICEAQARLTLQEVGKWLEGKTNCAECKDGEHIVNFVKIDQSDIDSFKRGEMPK